MSRYRDAYEPDDPVDLVAAIEKAVSAFDGAFSEQERVMIRQMMADILATHPTAAPVVTALKPAPQVQKSGAREREDAPAASDDEAAGGER